jgi:hypothetical protein
MIDIHGQYFEPVRKEWHSPLAQRTREAKQAVLDSPFDFVTVRKITRRKPNNTPLAYAIAIGAVYSCLTL